MNAREYWANGPDESAEDRAWCDVLDGIHENEGAQSYVALKLAESHADLIAGLTTPSRYADHKQIDADLAELERVSGQLWAQAAHNELARRREI